MRELSHVAPVAFSILNEGVRYGYWLGACSSPIIYFAKASGIP